MCRSACATRSESVGRDVRSVRAARISGVFGTGNSRSSRGAFGPAAPLRRPRRGQCVRRHGTSVYCDTDHVRQQAHHGPCRGSPRSHCVSSEVSGRREACELDAVPPAFRGPVVAGLEHPTHGQTASPEPASGKTPDRSVVRARCSVRQLSSADYRSARLRYGLTAKRFQVPGTPLSRALRTPRIRYRTRAARIASGRALSAADQLECSGSRSAMGDIKGFKPDLRTAG